MLLTWVRIFKVPALIWLKTFPHCDEADVYEPFHRQSVSSQPLNYIH